MCDNCDNQIKKQKMNENDKLNKVLVLGGYNYIENICPSIDSDDDDSDDDCYGTKEEKAYDKKECRKWIILPQETFIFDFNIGSWIELKSNQIGSLNSKSIISFGDRFICMKDRCSFDIPSDIIKIFSIHDDVIDIGDVTDRRDKTWNSFISDFASTVLLNGDIFLCGGYDHINYLRNGFVFFASQIFNVRDNKWLILPESMKIYRKWHTCHLLPNGEVIVIGGLLFGSCINKMHNEIFKSCIYIDFITQTIKPAPSMYDERINHASVLLPNGNILCCGGKNSDWNFFPRQFIGGKHLDVHLKSTEIYDHVNKLWIKVADMNMRRYNHTAVVINKNIVMVIGGYTYPNMPTKTCEYYYIDENRWEFAPDSPVAIINNCALLI